MKTFLISFCILSIANAFIEDLINVGNILFENENENDLVENSCEFDLFKTDFKPANDSLKNCLNSLNCKDDCFKNFKDDMISICEKYDFSLRRVYCKVVADRNYNLAISISSKRETHDHVSDKHILSMRIRHDKSGKCMLNTHHFHLSDNCDELEGKFYLYKIEPDIYLIKDYEGYCMSKHRKFLKCDYYKDSQRFRIESNKSFFYIFDEDNNNLQINCHHDKMEFGTKECDARKLKFIVDHI
jgi:hypothetical protein